MICPHCHRQGQPGEIYCFDCGTLLPQPISLPKLGVWIAGLLVIVVILGFIFGWDTALKFGVVTLVAGIILATLITVVVKFIPTFQGLPAWSSSHKIQSTVYVLVSIVLVVFVSLRLWGGVFPSAPTVQSSPTASSSTSTTAIVETPSQSSTSTPSPTATTTPTQLLVSDTYYGDIQQTEPTVHRDKMTITFSSRESSNLQGRITFGGYFVSQGNLQPGSYYTTDGTIHLVMKPDDTTIGLMTIDGSILYNEKITATFKMPPSSCCPTNANGNFLVSPIFS